MGTEEQIHELGRRWIAAEQSADVAALDALSTEDFTLVGPLGFVLDKNAWLGRYRSGALVTTSASWEEVAVRDYGSAAVAIGRQTQQAAYQGNPADGTFRVTQIAVRDGDVWKLAGLQFSPIANRG
jgi:hypothetical protein